MQKGMVRQHDRGSIYKEVWKIFLSHSQFCKQSDINFQIAVPLPINYITLEEHKFLSCILYCRYTQQIFAPYAKQQHWGD